MTEQKFDNKFHKMYVGGEGEVDDGQAVTVGNKEYPRITYEDVLAEYRKYIGDSSAELPESVVEELRKIGQI